MTTQAGGVRVRILGDDSDLNKKLSDSVKSMAKWGAAAAAAAAVGAVAITKSTAAAAKEVSNLSNLVNMSVVDFQKQAAAAKSVGIEQDKLADIYKDSSDKLGDFLATGAGPMVDYFENVAPLIGQTADEFKNLSGSQVLQKYVDGLEKANVSQDQMTFYMEAIASDATLLLPLLEDNGAAFEELGNRAENAGAVLSAIDVAKMEALQGNIAAGNEALTGMTNQIALQLAPVLQGLGDLFTDNADGAETMRKAIEKTFEFTIKGAGFVGDSIRGIQVVVKGIEAAFWALSAVTAEIFEQIARGVDDFVVKPALASINALIDGANVLLPGSIELDRMVIGESAAVQKLTAISDAATAKMKEVGGELHDLLMEPLPSKALDDFVALSQKKAQEAAEAAVEIKNNTGLVIPTIDVANDPEVMAEQAKNDALLKAYSDYAALRFSSQEAAAANETKLAKELAESQKAIAEQELNGRLSVASNMFSNLSSLMNTENKKLFEVGKAAAISGAVVDGIAAAISSFKVGAGIGGPVLGAAYAATSVVATGVQIAQLAGTSYGSGATQAAAPSVNEPTVSGSAAGQQGSGAATGQTLTLEGLNQGDLVSYDQLGSLVTRLNEFAEDGGTPLVVLA